MLVTNLSTRSSLLMVYVSAFGQVYFNSMFHFFLLWSGEINASPADLIGLLWASSKQTHMKYLCKLWGALHLLDVNVEKCFPSGSVVKNPLANAGDAGLFPGVGRSPGEGKGYPLQYSGLKNSMNCIVHGVAESDLTEWLSLSGVSQDIGQLVILLLKMKMNMTLHSICDTFWFSLWFLLWPLYCLKMCCFISQYLKIF